MEGGSDDSNMTPNGDEKEEVKKPENCGGDAATNQTRSFFPKPMQNKSLFFAKMKSANVLSNSPSIEGNKEGQVNHVSTITE